MNAIDYKNIKDVNASAICETFGEWIKDYFHQGEGCFSLVALDGEQPIGFISTYPSQYPHPISTIKDAYIDVIEVDINYRQKGIARTLIQKTESLARTYGYKQIRAWSNSSKVEAISMWVALGYCMCPARIWVEWCQEVVNGFYVAKKL